MIRNTLSAFAAFMLIAVAAIPARAENVSTEKALGEMSLGKKDAPVVIYAFESLTCPHCKAFHDNAYKKIKTEYVDTGKVRIVFKDYPLNGQAFYGTLVARCLGPDRYVGMTEMLFENQAKWAGFGGDKFFQTLAGYARLAGMTEADFKKCINDKALIDGVQAAQKEYNAKYKIQSTPTFVIGTPKTIDTDAAKRIEGAQSFEIFEGAIKSVLPDPAK
ncbi:MAG: DsbA family protein [Bauldia litoralis]